MVGDATIWRLFKLHRTWRAMTALAFLAGIGHMPARAAEVALPAATKAVLRQICQDCHGNDLAEGKVNLEQLSAAADVGSGFKDWEKAIQMLR